MDSRQCTTCKEIKPSTDFFARPTSKDGLHRQCKHCLKLKRRNKPRPVHHILTEKVCPRCGILKSENEFYHNVLRRDNRSLYCKKCDKEIHGPVSPEQDRKRRYFKEFGLTIEDYDRMLNDQGGRCAICKTDIPGKKYFKYFAIDHDHKTGKVRALLCQLCNQGLGHFHDSPEQLEAAANYIRRYK